MTERQTGYTTAERADAYISARYAAADDRRLAWDTLTAEDKQRLIKRASGRVDGGRYRGYAAGGAAFPRCMSRADCRGCNSCADMNIVAAAVAEEALEMASPGADSLGWQAARSGVQAVRMGNFSEQYAAAGAAVQLCSGAARDLLARYGEGSYAIRG